MYLMCKNNVELEIPSYFNKGNINNCLIYFSLSYGVANGYEKRFEINIFSWNRKFYFGKDTHNGHGRFSFDCRLFSFFFDYNDKKSIIFKY